MALLSRFTFVMLSILAATAVNAQRVPIAGIDYREIGFPHSAEAGRTIEVVEYFWYRCPHCYALEPLLDSWIAKLPKNARFRRIPAVLRSDWIVDARAFFALATIGELDRLHRPLYDAIHLEGGKQHHGRSYSRWLVDWLRTQGVDMDRYEEALDSPGLGQKVKKAADLSRSLRLEGTPTLVVDGRYIVDPAVGDRRRILQVADHLISRVQAEKLARR